MSTWLGWGAVANAHDAVLTAIDARFEASGRFLIDVHYDVDAWLVGAAPQHLSAEARAAYLAFPAAEREQREQACREFLRRLIRLRFDDAVADFRIDLVPEVVSPDSASLNSPDANPHDAVIPGRMARLTGAIPKGGARFSLSCSRVFGNVILTLRCGDGPITIHRLDRGGRSESYSIVFGADGSAESSSPRQGPMAAGLEFIALGFQHILPEGLDHIAFVLALFLLSQRWSVLLWQVTAFTAAHSITLSLAVLGYVRLSPATLAGFVEPMIALSIAFVAIENLCTSKLHVWRPIVVFLFGLLHGLGFASVLMELGIPPGRYFIALAGFNVGVELGQISVILTALAMVGWFRRAAWYRGRVVIPVSFLIALIGAYWSVTRFMGV